MAKKLIVLLYTVLVSSSLFAQRISDENIITWLASFNTLHFTKKTSLLLEYQWRREGPIENWQQSLARTGLQYQFGNGMSAMVGYAYIITYPYNDHPSGPHPTPEQRIFEQLVWNDDVGRVALNHRFRFEQRFSGKVDQSATEYEVLDWTYTNRIRYQLRGTVPLNNKKMGNKTWYATAFDEIFISFGKNVNQNVFDQNRIGAALGYQLNNSVRGEIGIFNQTQQQGSLVAGKQVYQYNTGMQVNLYLTKPAK